MKKKFRIYYSMPLITEIEAESAEEAKKLIENYGLIEAANDSNTFLSGENNEIHEVKEN